MEKRFYNVYKFEELPEKSQVKAIEKHRYITVDHDDWSYYILEDFIEEAGKQGFNIELENINYSGFCSQGDGSSFDCNDIDLVKIIDFIGNPKYFKLKNLVNFLYFKTEKTSYASHYCHEKTRYIDYEIDTSRDLTDRLHRLISDLHDDIEALRLELSSNLYKRLYEAYYEYTSDDKVKETLIANDYDFTIEGDID